MTGQKIVLVTLAGTFGFGALAILACSLTPRTRDLSKELGALYRSEFVIVGALLIPAFLGMGFFLAVALAFLVRAQFELARLFRSSEIRIVSPLSWATLALTISAFTATAAALRIGENGFVWIFFVYAVVEIGDAFALLIGKLFGRTRILPRLSPHKTLEGLLGGFLFGGTAGFLLAHYLLELEPAVSAALGLIVLFAGLTGDLLTSALKRAFAVKDFAPVLARHGGVLDIYDSFLMAAPAAFAFRLFLGS